MELGGNQKSKEREGFLRSIAEEFELRFRNEGYPGPVFEDMTRYREVSVGLPYRSGSPRG